MWVDCQDFLINTNNIDYINFDHDDNGVPCASIYFVLRLSPVIVYSEDLNELKKFFLQSMELNK